VQYIDARPDGPGTVQIATHLKEHIMFGVLAVILVVAWFLGFSVFHVAGGMLHILLIVAVASLVWHFISGRRTVV
jgi:hypothetical protein